MAKETEQACELSVKELDIAIKALKKNQSCEVVADFILPVPQWRIDRKKYKGFGRPRKEDYVWVDFVQHIKEIKKYA